MKENQFTKDYIKTLKPVIDHLNQEIQHRYYQYLFATSDPDNYPMDEPESCFVDDRYWHQTMWGGNQILINNNHNNSVANALNQNEIRLCNGHMIDNPFVVKTSLVQIICMDHQVDYEKFENYRNYYNQILAHYGAKSKEFKAVNWRRIYLNN